jgi:pimeloyl-ACP methyl ester carboxylesterase
MSKPEFGLPYPLNHEDINGVSWEYISTEKRDKTFVLLPGGGQTAESNYRFIRALEPSYRVIAPTIHEVESIAEFNRALNSILNKEKVDNVILYGLSMGGNLAQTYARDYPERIQGLILSHTCTPKSDTYRRKVIQPLCLVSVLLPVIPDSLIKFATKFSGKIQGTDRKTITKYFVPTDPQERGYTKAILEDYYKNFLDKKLLRTTIKIHQDLYRQVLSPRDFNYLQDRILILRTDNDPLMQDDGDFLNVYPRATVHVFEGTGHLTFQLQEDKIIQVIQNFLKSKNLK